MDRILIIEDDENILRLEKDYLEANGFETDTAPDGVTGLRFVLDGSYSLVLLDIMLPGLNGFEVCKKIREEKNIPILLVSAKKDEPDKINGLGFGADDYIVKPFSPSELVARVKAHISRYRRLTNPAEKDVVKFENLELNKESGEVFLNGQEISLTKKEFDVLYLMASKPETVFSKNELFERVWGEKFLDNNNTVMAHIGRLREKLGEPAKKPRFIKTVWGVGYTVE